MLKLYKKNKDNWEYWETWEKDENSSAIHYGIVGDRGNLEFLEENSLAGRQKILKTEIKKKVDTGYRPIEENDLQTLILEYKTTDNSQLESLEKRNQLESKLNELLGWFGLGHCDGGTSSKDTIEVFCLVIDYDIAYKIITDNLSNTIFSDYVKIYHQVN